MEKLTVVIVNYNVKHYLEGCLLTLPAALGSLSCQVVVVDNASTDGSENYLCNRFPHLIYLYNRKNLGFAAACNQGIRLARGEYILLLNPDTELPESGSLESAVCFMDRHPEAGSVGARMFTPQGEFLRESARGYPTLAATFGKLSGLGRFIPSWGKYYSPVRNVEAPVEVEVLAGAFMLLRREALDKCGLLDESFFMYGEDVDLSCRLLDAGYRNYSLPIRVIHYKGASTNHRSFSRLRHFYGAMEIFYRKHTTDCRLKRSFVISSIRLLLCIQVLKNRFL